MGMNAEATALKAFHLAVEFYWMVMTGLLNILKSPCTGNVLTRLIDINWH